MAARGSRVAQVVGCEVMLDGSNLALLLDRAPVRRVVESAVYDLLDTVATDDSLVFPWSRSKEIDVVDHDLSGCEERSKPCVVERHAAEQCARSTDCNARSVRWHGAVHAAGRELAMSQTEVGDFSPNSMHPPPVSGCSAFAKWCLQRNAPSWQVVSSKIE